MLKQVASARMQAANAQSVLYCVYRLFVRRYRLRLLLATTLGVAARFFTLMTFVVAIKGIIVALNIEHFAQQGQAFLDARGYDISLSSSTIVMVAVGALLFVNVGAMLSTYWRSLAVTAFQQRFLDAAGGKVSDVVLARDRFFIERAAPAIDTVVKISEIAMFCLLTCALIAISNLNLLLVFAPLLIVLPLAVLATRRERLQLVAERQNAVTAYRQKFPNASPDPARVEAWRTSRQRYIDALLNLQNFQIRSQHAANAVMSVGLIAIIVYLSGAWRETPEPQTMSPYVIFVVLALRQILVSAMEFGREFSALLELRSDLNFLEDSVALLEAKAES